MSADKLGETSPGVQMPIVLVYLGSRLPLYALLNLRYLRRTFPAHEVWLVSDSGFALRQARALGVRTYRCADPMTSWAVVRDRTPYRLDFRKGFWFLTYARFYALREFALAKDVGAFLHVEADVWISAAFPFSALASLGSEVAFPLERAGEGVASTLYCAGTSAITALVEHAEHWARAGETMSDMGFLGRIAATNLVHTTVLPSAPDAVSLFTDDIDADTARLMSGGGQRLDGLFDGMAWGIDLLGEDPRNHWGSLRLFRPHRAGCMNTSLARIAVDDRGMPVVHAAEAVSIPLYSLHVHSKDLLLFLAPKWRLAQRVRQRRGGPRSIWLPHVFIRILWSLGVPWIRRHLPQRSSNSRSV